MTLVTILSADDADPLDQPALDGGVAAYGKVLNTWGAILHSPGLFGAYLPFLRQVNGPGELDQRIKDLSAVRVAVLNGCTYTCSHRQTSALANGATLEEVEAAAAGNVDASDDRLHAAVNLAEEMSVALPRTRPSDSTDGLSPAVRDRLAGLFSERELVELVMSISVWNALSRFHRVMGFGLDMPEPSPAISALL